MLLGRLMMVGNRVLVDEVTIPGPNDRRSRFHFWRAERPAQEIIDAAWRRSNGELNYLGEWHTHPEDAPLPSSHDRMDWRRLVTIQSYEQPSLFFIIAGRRTISAWEMNRMGRAIRLPALEPDVQQRLETPNH